MLVRMHALDYVQCPDVYVPQGRRSLFLAGGITKCPDWRADLRRMLPATPWVLLNPRRPNLRMDDDAEATAQIEWEHQHLHLADAVLFWFCSETLQPITLYELGACSMSAKPLFVGVHPAYLRSLDVIVQTRLNRPEVQVVDSLHALAAQVRSAA
jgi:hypothetical protein